MTTKREVLKAIRAHCIDCSGGKQKEADLCTCTQCDLHALRFGRDPSPSKNVGFAKRAPVRSSQSVKTDLQVPTGCR